MNETEIYGWKYIAYKENDKLKYKIVPSTNVEKPSTLFRYYSNSERAIDSLIARQLYASHPDEFNDLYDCSDELIKFDDDEVIIKFLSHGDSSIANTIREKLKNERPQIKSYVERNFKQVLYRKLGIVCLTSNPNNLLMWAYYSNNKGFLVEYDYEKWGFDFHGPFPVNYQDTILPFSIKDSSIALGAIYQSNIKSSVWNHEKEWRVLLEHPNGDMKSPDIFQELANLGGQERLFEFKIESIKTIALGNRFFYAKEISETPARNLSIKLEGNLEPQRLKLLNFIVKHSIPMTIAVRKSNFIEIEYAPIGKLIIIAENHYEFRPNPII